MAEEGTPCRIRLWLQSVKIRLPSRADYHSHRNGFRSVNVALRKNLDLYACLRPCKTYPGVPSLYRDVNIVVVRENTEDVYAG